MSIEEDSSAFLSKWLQRLIDSTVKHIVYIQVEFLLNPVVPIVSVFSLFILVKKVPSSL